MHGRAPLLPLLFTFIAYPLVAWLVLRFAPQRHRAWLFALVNVVGAYIACVTSLIDGNTWHVPLLLRNVGIFFLGYLLLVLIIFALLRQANKRNEAWDTVALWFPIVMLILLKYVPSIDPPFVTLLRPIRVLHVSAVLLGLSYLAFRLCHLVQEVKNKIVEQPTLAEYLSFAFFVPTLNLGPINPYSRYIASYRQPNHDAALKRRALLRILIGLVKYLFLSSLLNQYTYSGLLLDGHPHYKMDLVIALFSYTLFLYCNFSGFCDMVIGVSGLIGIDVMENFNVPFTARNLQEFWNRWHISLSTWLRDMMFTPLVKILVRRFGPKSRNNMIALSICVVFVIIGIWHGVGINFAMFGLFHGVGLATVHYYTVFLKKRLGPQRYSAYRANRLIHGVGVIATFVYFSVSLFFFANSWADMHRIFAALI